MEAPRPVSPSETTSERLVFFTDAVAAIALTLLVLPLVEIVPEAAEEHASLGDLLHEHTPAFLAFLLSFSIIFRLWWAHHKIFRHVTLIRTNLVVLSAAWTLAIVILPIPTAIITAYRPSPGSVALYGGTLALASASLALLSWYAYRHPGLSVDRDPVPREVVLGNVSTFIAEVIATVIGAVFADTVNYWAFLLLFLTAPIERAIKSRWRRRATA